MKTTLLLLTSFLLASCSSNRINAKVGYYTPSTAKDPDAKFGAFISKAEPKVIPAK